jgi:hypothetical protein
MSRMLWTMCTLTAVIIVANLVMRLAVHHDAPNLTGRWKSWRSELQISRDGDLYKVTIDNPNGLLGGIYRGEFWTTRYTSAGHLLRCAERSGISETLKNSSSAVRSLYVIHANPARPACTRIDFHDKRPIQLDATQRQLFPCRGEGTA